MLVYLLRAIEAENPAKQVKPIRHRITVYITALTENADIVPNIPIAKRATIIIGFLPNLKSK